MDQKPTVPKVPSAARLRQIGLVFIILVSISSGFLGGWLGAASRDQQSSIDTSKRAEIISSESELINDVAEQVGQSVVSVNVVSVGSIEDFFGTRAVEQQSAGTGIIISEEGIIVTNRHVVPEGSSDVSVTLSDGTELENVEIIGRTTASDPLDIAFLKITDKEGKSLKPATLGDSADVEVGDKVIAIGNALGQFQNTVTSGIISGFGRSVVAGDGSDSESLQNLFQTDAAINQGNSGGPLVNIDGKVIGINTAVAGNGAENIGFAIPIDDIKGVVDTVLTTGKVERPYLGVRYVSLTDDLAEQFDLDVKRGAFVVPEEDSGEVAIVPGSPAAKAGLQPRDVILKINGNTIDEKHSLTSVVGRFKVGDEVTLTIRRGGNDQEIKVKLEAQT